MAGLSGPSAFGGGTALSCPEAAILGTAQSAPSLFGESSRWDAGARVRRVGKKAPDPMLSWPDKTKRKRPGHCPGRPFGSCDVTLAGFPSLGYLL